jgi:hypothetical protein
MFTYFVVTRFATFLGLNAKLCGGRECGGTAIISLLFWTLPSVWGTFDTRDVSECGFTPAACKFVSETGQCWTQYWYNERTIGTTLPVTSTSSLAPTSALNCTKGDLCVLTWLELWQASRVPGWRWVWPCPVVIFETMGGFSWDVIGMNVMPLEAASSYL